MEAVLPTAVSHDRSLRAHVSGGRSPFLRLSIDGIDYLVAVPSDDGVCVFVQGLGKIGFAGAVCPNTNNTFPQLLRVFDLPVHPVAISRVGRDIDDQGTGPCDSWSENFTLNVFRVLRLVEVAYKYILGLVGHYAFPSVQPHSPLYIRKFQSSKRRIRRVADGNGEEHSVRCTTSS